MTPNRKQLGNSILAAITAVLLFVAPTAPQSQAQAAVPPHACSSMGGPDGFITTYFQCEDQLQDYPISLAQVGSYLYLVYFNGFTGGGTPETPEIISTQDKGNHLIERAFYWDEHMSIAEYKGKLYVAWAESGQGGLLKFGRVETSSGVVTGVTFLGAAQYQGTDGTPAIAAFDDIFYIGWQSKDNPPHLNFAEFSLPSSPPNDLVASFRPHGELTVKNAHQAPVSIAVIEKTPYVAFETEGLACQVVKFSEDGQSVQGEFISTEGCRAPSIAAVGETLYLACLGKDDNLHLYPVILDKKSKAPTGLGNPFPNPNQYDQDGAVITSTADGLMIVWREKGINNRLRIGSVKLN